MDMIAYCNNCAEEYVPAISCDSGMCDKCLYLGTTTRKRRNKHLKAIEQQALVMCNQCRGFDAVSRVDFGNILLQLVKYIQED